MVRARRARLLLPIPTGRNDRHASAHSHGHPCFLAQRAREPPWRCAPRPDRTCIPDAPPPEVADDRAGRAHCGSLGAGLQEVDGDEEVGEVDDGEREEPEEGRLRAGRGERGGEIDEHHEERARVYERFEGAIYALRREG